ncbi:MAG TPA: glycine oxidase ThiO, partial [Longimicrobiaceae bacterium]
ASDVVVVGGGVVGCAVARHLALRGARVTVVERGRPGEEASWAAAGMLAPLVEADGPGPFLDLLLRAREEYPAFAAALREETGIDVGYSDAGSLSLALTDADERTLEARFAWQSAAGLPVERLTAEETRALEPEVAPSTRWALRFPGDHQVENRALARALWTAAARAGAGFRLGAAVAGVTRSGGRVSGVRLESGETLEAGSVVVAAGAWSGRLAGLPRPLPVLPVHGQILALEAAPQRFRHCVDSPRCYLVPRADGRLIAGATVERGVWRRAVTPAGVCGILTGAVEISPALADLPLAATWSGLRPGTPDDLPVLGPDPELPGLFHATGHYRNGILLAPLTGEAVGEAVLGGEPCVELAPYSAARFGGS